jgi:hypothetical protein
MGNVLVTGYFWLFPDQTVKLVEKNILVSLDNCSLKLWQGGLFNGYH